ncbi:MBOAT-domain-containing protein [Ascodesmis nigricans]|uniref:MBOAT-domain-containing protein n=1 Tax=Ascodesmis nigricans TaxID=341454 RepID=A0A4S2N5Y1_9PEZI|nr:MBOAT-domain-containing protein [Ascodesmis nigricans]
MSPSPSLSTSPPPPPPPPPQQQQQQQQQQHPLHPSTPLHSLTHEDNPLSRSSSSSSFDDARLPAHSHPIPRHPPTSTSATGAPLRRRKAPLQRINSASNLSNLPSPPATDSEPDAPGKTIPVTLESATSTSSYRLRLTPDLQSLLVSKTKRRPRFGDFVFTERFTAFDRLNPTASGSPYHGFFVLAWLTVGLWAVKTMAENYRETGSLMETDILNMMFNPSRAIQCLLVDVIMFYGSTLWCVPLQKAVAAGKLNWAREGWALQALAEVAVVLGSLTICLRSDWWWIQRVYLFLHSLVTLMKMHSYAAYNGYLSSILERKKDLEERLNNIKEDYDDHDECDKREVLDLINADLETCRRELSRTITAPTITPSAITPVTDTTTPEPLIPTTPTITYPENLTYKDYFLYLHFPTVVYELSYPRSSSRSWSSIMERLLATTGTLFTMVLISQTYIYPVVTAYVDSPPNSPAREYPWLLLHLIFPMTALYILVFYLIWETILNLLAEITRFSDRGFYNAWWNSTSWDAFARDWNVPVHAFLLRHVYHSAISAWKVKRSTATLVTFGISSVVHEMVMMVIFRKLRGYLLVAQMGQLPLVWLSRRRWARERKVLGNIMFWVGIAMGPGFLCAGYVLL